MIVITRDAYDRLIETCKAAWPEEACGILLSADGPLGPVDRVRPVRNAHPQPDRAFFFDPADWVRAWAETRQSRRRIAGFYHSHPLSPPAPSAADLVAWRRLANPELTYWIVSLSDKECPEISVWRLRSAGPDAPSVPAEIRVQIAERHDVARRDPL